MTSTQLSNHQVTRMVLSRTIAAVLVMLGVFFIPAGTFDYWQAWVVLAVILIPAAWGIAYMWKSDPGLMERRLRYREPHQQQQLIILISYPFFFLALLLPGLDHRFGWSQVPVAVVLAADIIIVAGYLLFFFVIRENSYASRVIEVEQGQKVINTGPYAVVRHPLYVASLLLMLALPIALGSYWAFIPTLPIVPLVMIRAVKEEQLLASELPGYTEYMQKVRFRLIPGLW
ncbi:MAG TPA: isoprenylcysteine carboxylmethyltransferase family protein [Anaerolineae bacterium]